MNNSIQRIDCLEGLSDLPSDSVDLVYLDPPFFTQKEQKLYAKREDKQLSFSDKWRSISDYADFISVRLEQCHRVLKKSGSLFFHCDKCASHIARFILEEQFGSPNFRSEIIWHYKRWSNSKAGLLPNHQNIFWFSKTADFKFNPIFEAYSPATNIDQILQKRARNENNTSVYAKDTKGHVITNGKKDGVPLSDVWDIPFLNPKAKERTGYPTQKPILLLERIITLVTDQGDTVLDPFFGSGTTLVAARLLDRNYIGFDSSKDACDIALKRLETPTKTASRLLEKGREAYKEADEKNLALLQGVKFLPVQRNHNIDAILPGDFPTGPLLVKIQKENETLSDAINGLLGAAIKKKSNKSIVIKTHDDLFPFTQVIPKTIEVVEATGYTLRILTESFLLQQEQQDNREKLLRQVAS